MAGSADEQNGCEAETSRNAVPEQPRELLPIVALLPLVGVGTAISVGFAVGAGVAAGAREVRHSLPRY